jgi:2Fe-2S ferredoxin
MAKITYVDHSGERRTIEVENGATVMEGAIRNGIPGIEAECGGACACATCHVHVDPKWIDIVGTAAPGSPGAGLLQFAEGSSEASRLACQVTITPELDGLVLHIPKGQH